MNAMKLNFKTLDNKNFSLTVNEDEDLVEDLISRIEDKFGRENLYKLIFAGKLLKEEDSLSKYKLKSKIPIIVMITHSPNIIIENSKEEKKSANEESTGSNSRRSSLEPACFKRVRTVTEDSGIEEDLAEDHFITDTELDSVIEIILSCPYLTEGSGQPLTEPELVRAIDKYCVDSDVDVDFWDILTLNTAKIVSAGLNKSQLMALLEDARDIFEEPRIRHSADKKCEEDIDRDLSDFEDEDVPEVSAPVQERPDSPSNKSLDFLRDIEEFQFLRYQVLHDPLLLQPLLLSFSQSHPGIMKIINENKETFIRMLYEQTGAKLTGRH